ncbi:MAG: homoserine O-acetyltransferase/O-succinyltransferase family protein, partial [Bacilli bacterium]
MSPVIIPKDLPATNALAKENIFVINKQRALNQDIRPLKICILNLMPDKITTETQLLRKLSNSIIQVEITLLKIKTHQSKNTSVDHLESFYYDFNEIKHLKYDALIITGAPLEHLAFKEVTYYNELVEILEWSKTNVFTSLFICWAALLALDYFYKIPKELLNQKLSGVYLHQPLIKNHPLHMGMNDHYYVPHSRIAYSNYKQIINNGELKCIAGSSEAGLHLVEHPNKRQVFMFGHPEYDVDS